jgi:hypothetical protein
LIAGFGAERAEPRGVIFESAWEETVAKQKLSGYELAVTHRRRFGLSFYGWMVIPATFLLLLITVYPFFWMIVMSLMKVAVKPGMKSEFVGFANFAGLVKDSLWVKGWESRPSTCAFR